MWLIIFGVSILAALAGAVYLSRKIESTGIFSQVSNKMYVTMLSVAATVLILFVITKIFDVTNMIIIVMHIAVFLLLGDLARFLIKKFSSSEASPRMIDLVAVLLCFIYLCIGWVLMHGMWETDYTLATGKKAGHIRVAHIADSHVGCGFNGEGFGERLEKIQAAEPDILVITGDFVDDDTSKEDMLAACAALGRFNTKYGIYFCFGNHDAGYYSNERRGYGIEELTAELERNGVTVLQDESVLIDDRFYVIGRRDAGYGTSDRIAAGDLVKDIDKDKYMIVLDHQPTDYDAEEAAGVDLVLSGHTHGGQIFPLEFVQPLVSQNDNVRGLDRRGNTDFIVTDGISDWAIKFRTGCKSEYNIIDIDGPAS